MKNEHFNYRIQTNKPIEEVFNLLLDIEYWWSGLYEETITGHSKQVDDIFTFKAGGGAHQSTQTLVELIPYQKIVWKVTESQLSFLNNQAEWNGTHLRFDVSKANGQTLLTFTHEGLVPKIECYDQCSDAWTGYMTRLKKKLS